MEKIRKTHYGNITVTYSPSWKTISRLTDEGEYQKRKFSPDYTTKEAIKFFRNYFKA